MNMQVGVMEVQIFCHKLKDEEEEDESMYFNKRNKHTQQP